MKTIVILFISVIGLPLYSLCVGFLLLLKPLLGWSYVDASVYVCEYLQPAVTAAVALLCLIQGIRVGISACRVRKIPIGLLMLAICVSYLVIGIDSIRELMSRLSEYANMNNRQIFDYVVHKLEAMGAQYPDGRVTILDFETVSYGYIIANMEVYILPISTVMILFIIQRVIRKRLQHYRCHTLN